MKTVAQREIKSKLYEEVEVFNEPTLKTGKKRFDKWFSKDVGAVINSAIYVSGTSGAGKTTLMVNLMKWFAPSVVSMYLREMEDRSVKEQTSNIKMPKGTAYMADVNTCPTFDDYVKELDVLKPKVVIVDSLQVIAMEDYEAKGIMSADKACYHIIKTLREWCSANNAILFLIGHNTKEGNFAGKNFIIQMMDAHIVMEHDKKNDCRKIYWGQKNRKGPMGMLYYAFGDEEIEFFTEDEWEFKGANEKTSFAQVAFAMSTAFISTLDKKHPNYKSFKEEYNEAFESLQTIKDDNEFVGELTKLIGRLSDKYGF